MNISENNIAKRLHRLAMNAVKAVKFCKICGLFIKNVSATNQKFYKNAQNYSDF